MSKKSQAQLAKELLKVKEQLDAAKHLYSQYDALLAELIKGKKRSFKVGTQTLEIVDNFESKNTVWKASGVRRFDAKIVGD